MTKKVALIKGDGCGPELVNSMINVFEAVNSEIQLITCDAGLEWWQVNGGQSFIPPETWEILKTSDACFKGPTTTLPDPNTPRSVAVSLRQRLKLYANIRPIKTFPRTVGPLGEVDFVCVREATEGLYSGLEHRISQDVAITIRKITRQASEQVAKKAFEEARQRGWNKVTVITKGNILKETDSLFYSAVSQIAKSYPEISIEEYYIDNFAQQLIKNPQRFNQSIILSTNLFMDILSEEASGLIGSIGLVYSGNFGDNYAMFEPAHGSSPKYKGQNKINPTATILSGAWMLNYLGEKEKSKSIFKSTEEVISKGTTVTYDLGGTSTTSEMAEAIATLARSNLNI